MVLWAPGHMRPCPLFPGWDRLGLNDHSFSKDLKNIYPPSTPNPFPTGLLPMWLWGGEISVRRNVWWKLPIEWAVGWYAHYPHKKLWNWKGFLWRPAYHSCSLRACPWENPYEWIVTKGSYKSTFINNFLKSTIEKSTKSTGHYFLYRCSSQRSFSNVIETCRAVWI